jgi:hypothetical protein
MGHENCSDMLKKATLDNKDRDREHTGETT